MKLIEALEVLRREQPEGSATFRVSLACGFTPLHIQTFIAAELRLAVPDRKTEITAGLYGDLQGNLLRAEKDSPDVVIVLMEWGDLDARLGFRNLGSWAPARLADILENVKANMAKFVAAVQRLSRVSPVRICFPTLPLPPVGFSPTSESNLFDLDIQSRMSSLRLEIAKLANVKVVNADALDRLSPVTNRFDAKSELASGFPYKLPHAAAIAELMVRLIAQRTPKKGLITDLDDTLWSGIAGEVGAHEVSWDLEHQSHMHGAYQRLLHSLSEAGVLIAVASKNDAKLVDEALDRKDLMVPRQALFPVEAHWAAKSTSVDRILKIWNIGADAVVFLDDSPMELAEVQASYPEIQCIQFPKDDPQAIYELFFRLRDLFGKSMLSGEDAIRRESIRRTHMLTTEGTPTSGVTGMPDKFLDQAEAEITFSDVKDPRDPRALELINKTNQFNLNGRRYAEASWNSYLQDPQTFLTVVSYKDKYGPLGKIAVITGRKTGRMLKVESWVMSCRAFGRRIEHHSIHELFERMDVDEIVFDFEATSKNGPMRDYLSSIFGTGPTAHGKLVRSDFLKMGRALNEVVGAANG